LSKCPKSEAETWTESEIEMRIRGKLLRLFISHTGVTLRGNESIEGGVATTCTEGEPFGQGRCSTAIGINLRLRFRLGLGLGHWFCCMFISFHLA